VITKKRTTNITINSDEKVKQKTVTTEKIRSPCKDLLLGEITLEVDCDVPLRTLYEPVIFFCTGMIYNSFKKQWKHNQHNQWRRQDFVTGGK